MIKLNQLSMTYGSKLLFYDVDLLLNNHRRYALVGANGAGKSTLFKLLQKEETPTSGTLSLPKHASVGWLKQDQFRYEETRIIDVVIQGKPVLWQALIEKDTLLALGDWDEQVGYRLGELEEIIGLLAGYGAEAFAQKLLVGLGVEQRYHHESLKTLSGGFKLRVLLAQALFQQPDILLLDEPTNHLDIISIDWLEQYLKTDFQGLLVFISHDVEFINRLADNIIDIDYGEIREYTGQYDKFLAEKQLIETQKLTEKKALETKIAMMQSYVDRFRAKASKARQAQSRLKQIEKIELPDIVHSSRIAPSLHFKPKRPSGKQVLMVKQLSKSYSDQVIFRHLHCVIHRGEKIAIVGQNGTGKSTFLKILLGHILPDEGQITWGHETQISYFSQEHHDLLNKHISALDWLSTAVTQCTEQQIRKTLAQVLLTQEAVDKDILALSGGEAARLLLAKMMLECPNVLILDEPTNHLDLETIEVLANALSSYAGTVILVSHNRYFLHKVASKIFSISKNKGLEVFQPSQGL